MITAGEVLKKKRETLGRSIELVSQETKMQKRFITYIENNDFAQFDSEIFLTGFIKIYSQYLGLDTEKVLALYRRSKPQKKISKIKSIEPLLNRYKHLILTPKSIITILSVTFFILILGYIGLQIYRFQSPPQLTITTPTDGSTVSEAILFVEGTTQPSAILEINTTLVEIDTQGNFKQEITLKEGINIITIKAKKNSNNILETVETRKVTYNKPTQSDTPVKEVKTFNLSVEVTDTASWIKLDIDGQNKISKVVEPSKQQFEVKEKFYIITGRANNTTISMNDEPLAWKTNSTTGVAEITCTILNDTLNCE
ncbi:MAG: XRE family transcriptional regulator [candidate division WS6 bacterium GW2011_GWC1_36_11]|uniref:XRE family transcriptional regulator n=3 Tax=Candidatus Dojkabacteria TaxID=74243 RepID=A0A0G0GLZ7_9BACT|nr:MAG: XRE family transcriptional regulator [candidate division WS6 bacterium GW2011_GWC1_36_11]KKQ04288.1 MAG: XRE family transcriptional regulator [candidate division WS6 bacterium GW2011_WS6_36_26]KKQ11199.1 MAG: XRE family transcriptional regulator [candidate division WS6 bacterium GW2011_GWE1_36_69]KKQ12251.1 MAG: XRE family transcriptional regulator [candidate division WS6 bacterium GW2011_GWC2_36_7]KKQ17403.1 MAG: XRE family transcriptional regulator [candidate division WS6 bacterium GW